VVNQLIQTFIRTYKKYKTGLLFLLPALVLFVYFSWIPIARGLIISFQDYNVIGQSEYVGLANFSGLLTDPLFRQAWSNTVIYVVAGLVIGYFVPILIAIAVNEMRLFRVYFRIGYYLPAILPLVVTAILWKWIYNVDSGLLNYFLTSIGLPAGSWLQSPLPGVPIFCLVLMATWKGAGATMLIYLAALQGIPEALYEAAEIDGASIFQRVKNITLPQILPVMLIVLILQIIGTFQMFIEPFIMTDGGPNNATTTVLLQIYNYAFKYFEMGKASAMSMMLFIFLLFMTLIFFKITQRFDSGG
jgi:multiple sugar transport system permease protein